MKLIFLHADKHESFLQIGAVIFDWRWPSIPKVLKITNLQYPCKYLKETRKNEVDFLLSDRHQRFLQIDTIILDVCGQACPNYPK